MPKLIEIGCYGNFATGESYPIFAEATPELLAGQKRMYNELTKLFWDYLKDNLLAKGGDVDVKCESRNS